MLLVLLAYVLLFANGVQALPCSILTKLGPGDLCKKCTSCILTRGCNLFLVRFEEYPKFTPVDGIDFNITCSNETTILHWQQKTSFTPEISLMRLEIICNSTRNHSTVSSIIIDAFVHATFNSSQAIQKWL